MSNGDGHRPPRTTQRLGLPIPGDTGPADYVSATGALADVIDDRLAGASVPLVAPAALSQPAYATPFDGQTVDMVVDAVRGIVWRLCWRPVSDGMGWRFVGGASLEGYEATQAQHSLVNTWQGGWGPSITVPRPGIYRAEMSATVAVPSAEFVAIFVGMDRSGAPNDPYSAFIDLATSEFSIEALPSTAATVFSRGTTVPLSANEALRFAIINSVAWVTSKNRALTITPIRVS